MISKKSTFVEYDNYMLILSNEKYRAIKKKVFYSPSLYLIETIDYLSFVMKLFTIFITVAFIYFYHLTNELFDIIQIVILKQDTIIPVVFVLYIVDILIMFLLPKFNNSFKKVFLIETYKNLELDKDFHKIYK